jgi:hypothetical protein
LERTPTNTPIAMPRGKVLAVGLDQVFIHGDRHIGAVQCRF